MNIRKFLILFFFIGMPTVAFSSASKSEKGRKLVDGSTPDKKVSFSVNGIGTAIPEDGFVIKRGFTSAVILSPEHSVSLDLNISNYKSATKSNISSPSGGLNLGGVFWNEYSNAQKLAIHYSYVPAISSRSFYFLIGPAVQKEQFRVRSTGSQLSNDAGFKFANYGFDAITYGLDAGTGFRAFIEPQNTFVGIRFIELYLPTAELSYKAVNSRPEQLANHKIETPTSLRYKVLSLEVGLAF